jgi:hypothetical protein
MLQVFTNFQLKTKGPIMNNEVSLINNEKEQEAAPAPIEKSNKFSEEEIEMVLINYEL